MSAPALHTLFRPPAEARSALIRVADGCPWNACTFCGMYKSVAYRARDADEIREAVVRAAVLEPDAARVFLADGDVMAFPYERLRQTLECVNHRFPRVARISLYANGDSILARSETELRELKRLKLHTLYMGLESGDADTLRAVRKRETVDAMCRAGSLAEACGLRMSVMILIGLAGRDRSADHARATAAALNRMQPRLLSALRVIPVPGTPLHGALCSGAFAMLTEHEAVAELRLCLELLALRSTVFRANHTSNIVPLEGRLSRDKTRLLTELDRLLASGQLDRETPGPMPLTL